jgi:hypothetical protein
MLFRATKEIVAADSLVTRKHMGFTYFELAILPPSVYKHLQLGVRAGAVMASTFSLESGLAGLIDMTLSKAHDFAHRLRPTRVYWLLRNCA